jgi:hypothetical protein
MVGGTPSVTQTGTSDIVPAIWQIGQLKAQFTPCVVSATTGLCGDTNRQPGATLYVQLTYDMSNLLFLPTSFRMGSITTSLPTSLPAYTVYVMAE